MFVGSQIHSHSYFVPLGSPRTVLDDLPIDHLIAKTGRIGESVGEFARVGLLVELGTSYIKNIT